MSKQKKSGLANLTRKQQQAVIVCAVCALALVVTTSITAVLVSRQIKAAGGSSQPSSGSQSGPASSAPTYVVDSAAVLGESADAGDNYLKDTLFIGDSNTVRLYKNGLITLQQLCAQDGLTVTEAATKEFVTFKKDDKQYSIPMAVSKLKPRRVVITLGTNNADGSMTTEEFIAAYRELVQRITTNYSYTDVIINAIPPIPQAHNRYPDMDQQVIDQFNMALAALAEELGCRFLHSAEALKDETGYGWSQFFNKDDVHLTMSGLNTILNYARNHAWISDDRRPDTKNIPTRTEEFAGTVTPVVTATPAKELYASYYAPVGGTLTHDKDKNKTSLKIKVTDSKTSITVTAVPAAGFIFQGWSDGVKTLTRTDKNFDMTATGWNVTAQFVSGRLGLSASKASGIKVGEEVKLTAKLIAAQTSGSVYDTLVAELWKNAAWFVNDTKVNNATGVEYAFKPEKAGKYKIYMETTYNGQTLKSDEVNLEVAEPTPTPSPSPSPSPTPTPSPTPSPTPTPKPTASPSPTPSATPSPTPVVTPSPTPVVTPSPTPVVTPSPTPVVTPSPTPVVTPELDTTPAPQNENTPAPENEGTPAPQVVENTPEPDTATPEPEV